MIKYLLIFIFVTIPILIFNILWVYYLLKSVPFTRPGKVDRAKLRIFITWFITTILYSLMSIIIIMLFM